MGTRSKRVAPGGYGPVDRGARARLGDHEERLRTLEAQAHRIEGALRLLMIEVPVVIGLASLVMGWILRK